MAKDKVSSFRYNEDDLNFVKRGVGIKGTQKLIDYFLYSYIEIFKVKDLDLTKNPFYKPELVESNIEPTKYEIVKNVKPKVSEVRYVKEEDDWMGNDFDGDPF